MKKIIIVLSAALLAGLISCQKDGEGKVEDYGLRKVDPAYKDFAVILSKAVYNEPDLRVFLKEEALRQFDKDYDVFYPFAKDKLVDGKRTLRDILKQYDSEGKLEYIEKTIPKLTIMVPDWSWISENCFSVLNWETSSEKVVVCYDEGIEGHPVMMNGVDFATIPNGAFIDLPVLVLKSNERLVEKPSVKADAPQFSFLDPAFDGLAPQDLTKSIVVDTLKINGGGDNTDWVPKTQYNSQKLNDCYSMTSSVPGATQRDYIYYGLNASSSTGYIDNTHYESIYRYILNPSYDCYYETGDISFLSRASMNGYTIDQLKNFSWLEGNLEICFIVSAGFATPLYFYNNCSHSEAFIVTKVIVVTVVQGGFEFKQYFTNRSFLVGKWVYANLPIFTWDVSTVPVSYTVKVLEKDDGTTMTLSGSDTWQYTTNFSVNGEIGGEFFGLTCKLGYGIAVSNSSGTTTNTTISFTDNDDDLGTFVVQYINPVVLQSAMSALKIKSYDTGKIKVTIMPMLD